MAASSPSHCLCCSQSLACFPSSSLCCTSLVALVCCRRLLSDPCRLSFVEVFLPAGNWAGQVQVTGSCPEYSQCFDSYHSALNRALDANVRCSGTLLQSQALLLDQ